MPFVTVIMDPRQIELVAEYADLIQIGSRNIQNDPLLKEVGLCRKLVLLKRRIRTFETSTRNTLDLIKVPLLKSLTHLLVLIGPSHGTGLRWKVPAMSKVALAVGADGLIVEVHCKFDTALCIVYQSLDMPVFNQLMIDLGKVAQAVGQSI